MTPLFIARASMFLWVLSPLVLFGEAVLPAEVAKHLAENGSLLYAALFVASMATGLSAYLVRVIIQQHAESRADFVKAMEKVGALAEAMNSTPCHLVSKGLARVELLDGDRHSVRRENNG